MNQIKIEVRFPGANEGSIELTAEELKWMVDNGHVVARFELARPISMGLFQDYYKIRSEVRLQQQRRGGEAE